MKSVQTEAVALIPADERGMVKHQPTPAEILAAVVERGVTAENAAAVKEIVALMERQEDRSALKQFFAAFKKFQSEMPAIEVNKAVPTKAGGVKFKYATPEEIMRRIEKPLADNGFSMGFSQEVGNGTVTAICTLIHEGGHREVTRYSVHAAAPYDGSARDADVASSTVAQREAICFALKLRRTRTDVDATLLGPPISKEQAVELERRTKETGSDIAAFLRFAGAVSFDKISSAKYAMLDENLRRKEKTK